jgi:hypothetical protein
MSLHQIIYTSHSLVPMTGDELLELLDQSRRDNAAVGITGLLLHADGSFMQTIEGEVRRSSPTSSMTHGMAASF